MLFVVLLIEWIVIAWAVSLAQKVSPAPMDTPRRFYWKFVGKMSWRILALAIFPLPEIFACLEYVGFKGSMDLALYSAVIPIALYPIYILSVMWRAKNLCIARLAQLNAAQQIA